MEGLNFTLELFKKVSSSFVSEAVSSYSDSCLRMVDGTWCRSLLVLSLKKSFKIVSVVVHSSVKN